MSLDFREHAASAEAFSELEWQSVDTGHQRFSEPRRRIPQATASFARKDRQVLLTGARRYRITWSNGFFELDDTPPARLRSLIESIVSFCALSANWDSYGARPVDPRRAAAAIALLLDIVTADTPVPSIVPTNCGGVQLEWHCNDVDLEIEIVAETKCLVDFEDNRNGVASCLVLTGNLEPLDPLLKRLSQVN